MIFQLQHIEADFKEHGGEHTMRLINLLSQMHANAEKKKRAMMLCIELKRLVSETPK